MLLLVTVSTQAALWQEADHVALAAAESGVAAGAEVGGSPDGAKGRGHVRRLADGLGGAHLPWRHA